MQGAAAGHHRRPAAARPEAGRYGGRVADDDVDPIERHTELVGGDLGQRGLMTLAVRHLGREHAHGAVPFQAHPDQLVAHEAAASAARRPRPGRRLDVGRHAEPEVAAFVAGGPLPRSERRHIDDRRDVLHRLA